MGRREVAEALPCASPSSEKIAGGRFAFAARLAIATAPLVRPRFALAEYSVRNPFYTPPENAEIGAVKYRRTRVDVTLRICVLMLGLLVLAGCGGGGDGASGTPVGLIGEDGSISSGLPWTVTNFFDIDLSGTPRASPSPTPGALEVF